jgi:hypothetical protein
MCAGSSLRSTVGTARSLGRKQAKPDRAFVHERTSGTRQLAWRYTKLAEDQMKWIADRVKDRIADRVKDRIADRVYKVDRRADEADS